MLIGTDIIEIKRMKLDTKFLVKVLSVEELKMFNSFDNKKRKKEFVAGRWAAKEALIKSTSKRILPNKVNVGYKVSGAPFFTNEELNDFSLSISHENKYAIAVVINNAKE